MVQSRVQVGPAGGGRIYCTGAPTIVFAEAHIIQVNSSSSVVPAARFSAYRNRLAPTVSD